MHKTRERLSAVAFVMPAIVIIATVVVYPLIRIAYLSTQKHTFINPNGGFIGINGFVDAFTSPRLGQVALQSIEWTFFTVIFQLIVGLSVAVLLNQQFVGRTFLRTLILIPWVMPGTINGILWRLLYDPQIGLVNALLGWLGLPGNGLWLADPNMALKSLIFAAVWKGSPLSILLYLAAYQSVSRNLIEAAQIDGASALATYWHVTLPSIAPVIGTTVLLTTIWTFNYFDLIWVATKGGPGVSTHIAPTFIYEQAFVNANLGQAAVYSVMSIAALTVVAVIWLRQIRQRGMLT